MGTAKNAKKQATVLISYKGDVTDDLFHCVMELVEDKLGRMEASTRLRRKIYRIMVESLQNVYHHFDDTETIGGSAFPVTFSLEKGKANYQIETGNHILMNKVDELKGFIDGINQMSSQELKDYYRQQLSNGQFSSLGGAGLGIIDIIRKSGEKITYQFHPVNSDYSYFSLNVKIPA